MIFISQAKCASQCPPSSRQLTLLLAVKNPDQNRFSGFISKAPKEVLSLNCYSLKGDVAPQVICFPFFDDSFYPSHTHTQAKTDICILSPIPITKVFQITIFNFITEFNKMSLIMWNIPDDAVTLTYGIRLMRPTMKIFYAEPSNQRLPSSVNKDFFTFQVALLIYGHLIYVTK